MIAFEELLNFQPVIDRLTLSYAQHELTDEQMASEYADEKVLRTFAYAHRDYARRCGMQKLNSEEIHGLFFSEFPKDRYYQKITQCMMKGYLRVLGDVNSGLVWIGQ